MVSRTIRATAICFGCALAGFVLAGSSDADVVSVGLNSAMPAKLGVSEQFAHSGKWVGSNAAADFEPTIGGPTSVNISAGGLVTVTFNSPADLAGKVIVLTPSDGGHGKVNWACKASGEFPLGVLPKQCQ